MTDDHRERTLLALPLEEPPAHLRPRLASPATVLSLAIGVVSVWWISNLTLMPQPRIAVTNRP